MKVSVLTGQEIFDHYKQFEPFRFECPECKSVAPRIKDLESKAAAYAQSLRERKEQIDNEIDLRERAESKLREAEAEVKSLRMRLLRADLDFVALRSEASNLRAQLKDCRAEVVWYIEAIAGSVDD